MPSTVYNMISRGASMAMKVATGKIAKIRVRMGVDDDADVDLYQQFGFASRPPKGAHVVVVAIGGERSDAIAISTMHRDYLLALDDDGDCAIFDTRGQVVKLTADGIVLKSTSKVVIDCPDVRLTGDGASEPIPLGTALLTWLNGHTHASHGAVSLPPADGAVLSTKAKVG